MPSHNITDVKIKDDVDEDGIETTSMTITVSGSEKTLVSVKSAIADQASALKGYRRDGGNAPEAEVVYDADDKITSISYSI